MSTAAARTETDAYAWALAFIPIVHVPLALLAPELYTEAALPILTLLATIALGGLDLRQLRAAGWKTDGMVWGLLLIPIYLIVRTRVVTSTPAIPITWVATFAAAMFAIYLAPNVYDFDGAAIADDVSTQLSDQTDADVTATCPDAESVSEGDTIDCDVNDGTTSGVVRVTFNDEGSYMWQLVQ